MGCGVLDDAVGPDHHCEEIVETEWRCYIEPVIGLEPNANRVNHRSVTLQRLVRGGKLRVCNPKATLEPEVDASLVAHLDRTHAAQCGSSNAPNYGIFGFP